MKNIYEILINVDAELKLIDVASINVKSSCRAIVRKVFVTLSRVNTRRESIVDTEIPTHLRSNLFLATNSLVREIEPPCSGRESSYVESRVYDTRGVQSFFLSVRF